MKKILLHARSKELPNLKFFGPLIDNYSLLGKFPTLIIVIFILFSSWSWWVIILCHILLLLLCSKTVSLCYTVDALLRSCLLVSSNLLSLRWQICISAFVSGDWTKCAGKVNIWINKSSCIRLWRWMTTSSEKRTTTNITAWNRATGELICLSTCVCVDWRIIHSHQGLYVKEGEWITVRVAN